MIDLLVDKVVSALDIHISNYKRSDGISKAIKKYVEIQYEKLRLTKNTLFKNEPIEFYQSYVPLTLKQSQKNNSSNSLPIKISNPIKFIEAYQKSIVLGSAGSGKTTLLRFITLKCIEESAAIPILIELRHFKSAQLSFEDFITSQISLEYSTDIKQLFEKGRFIFLFDGFDEINYKEGEVFINELESFVSNNFLNSFVISSRPGTNIENLAQFFVFEISSLNENDIYIFIDKFNLSNKTKERILESFNSDTYLKRYLSIPLFLSAYIQYVDINIDADTPSKKSLFFRRIVDLLFSKHDSISKLGFVRSKLSGLSKDELESVSSILAFRTFISSKFEFSKDELYNEFEIIKRTKDIKFDNEKLVFDLTITINILVENGDFFYFQHILLLEYLAALFIVKLPKNNKEDFYMRVAKNNSIYLSSSFLNLLLELDRLHFLKGFLITTLKLMADGSYQDRNYSNLVEFIESSFSQHLGFYKNVDKFVINEILNSVEKEVAKNMESNFDELFNF